MNLQLALAGAVPPLALMWYVDRLDAKRPEPPWLLRRMAIAGGVSALPCALAEVLIAHKWHFSGYANACFEGFVMAAVVEELAKLLCLRLFIWNRPEFDERMDGIVYAARAGLGFALVENVGYLLGAKSMASFAVMYVLRALLAVPGHAIYAGIMGYAAARRRFDGAGPGLLGGYLFAVLLHGTYDAGAFSADIAFREHEPALGVALFAIPVVVIVFGGMALRGMARRAQYLDDARPVGLPA
jgi:RsiW-degrading membrane proteinase PrsW (M82 family)